MRFLVGLLPSVVGQLSKLFVIRESYTGKWYQCDFAYELELLHECTDDSMKTVLARALLDAPVVTDSKTRINARNAGSQLLFFLFTDEQRHAFLRKVYNCELRFEYGLPTLCLIRKNIYYLCDSFVVRFVYSNNCSVRMLYLHILHSEIPVEMIMRNITDVGLLSITFGALVPESSFAISSPPPRQVPSSTLGMYLCRVQGMNRICTLSLPDMQELVLDGCDDVISLERLSRALPKLRLFHVMRSTLSVTTQTVWSSVREVKLDLSHLQENQGDFLSRQQAEDRLRRICPRAEVEVQRYEYEENIVKNVAFSMSMPVDVPADCSKHWLHIFLDGAVSEKALAELRRVIGRIGPILGDVKEETHELLLTFASYPLLMAFLKAFDDGRLQTALSSALVTLGVLVKGTVVKITINETLRQQMEDTLRLQGPLPMTEKHQDILKENFERLTCDLNHDVLLHRLVCEKIFSIAENEELRGPPSAENAEKLLTLLMERGDNGFYVLIEVCRGSDMPALAILLEDADQSNT